MFSSVFFLIAVPYFVQGRFKSVLVFRLVPHSLAKFARKTLECIQAKNKKSQCPTMITRSEWGAADPKKVTQLKESPAPFVVIHHTDTPNCASSNACMRRVKNIQDYHMNNRGWDDIGYNFLVGGDGNVYEGRGWDVFGAHVPRYNSKSIGISLIGSFSGEKPPQNQLEAAKKLIHCGKENGHIAQTYRLIGHRQGKATTCPGNSLFKEISTWENFDASIRP